MLKWTSALLMHPRLSGHYAKQCSRMHTSLSTPRGRCTKLVSCQSWCMVIGGECWTPLRKHLKMNTLHHRCICTVLGITNRRQWEERISSEKVREQWGDVETITEKLMKRRLEWLGHIAQTPNCQIPKMCLFVWLPLPGWYQGLVRGLICLIVTSSRALATGCFVKSLPLDKIR